MLRKDKRRLYRGVRRTLGRFTPLRTDCGVLCGERCCGGDSETGMLLFPGEPTTLAVQCAGERRVAVCRGTCERRRRPLSCRLFPVLPVRDAGGRVRVAVDLRGGGLCPLVQAAREVRFSQRFLHRVRRAGEALYADGDCRRFLTQALAEGEETAHLFEIFRKKEEDTSCICAQNMI